MSDSINHVIKCSENAPNERTYQQSQRNCRNIGNKKKKRKEITKSGRGRDAESERGKK